MRRTLGLSVLGACIAAASHPALAHHSFAMFDQTKCLKMVGTIKKFEFTYPHTWLWLAVEDDNHALVLWGMQGADPASMAARGLSADSFKVGDRITVVYNPLKDGRHGGSLQQVIRANGQAIKTVGDYEECGKPKGAAGQNLPGSEH